MSNLKLGRLLRERSDVTPTFFFQGPDAIWYNSTLIVVNDPYLLSMIREKRVQHLHQTGNERSYQIQPWGEGIRIHPQEAMDPSHQRVLQPYLEAPYPQLDRLTVSDGIITHKKTKLRGYGLCTPGRKSQFDPFKKIDPEHQILLIQAPYLDYLTEVAQTREHIHYFARHLGVLVCDSNRIRGVAMPRFADNASAFRGDLANLLREPETPLPELHEEAKEEDTPF